MLRLRPIEDEDVRPLAELLAHPDLIGRRGLNRDRPVARSVSALSRNLQELVDPSDGDGWVVDVDGTLVGLATVGWWWDAHSPWAHVVIAPDHRRQGHGTAAAHLVGDHLFGHTVALLVEYSVPSWDADSLSFADSLGGMRTGIRRRSGIRDGRYHDTVEFALERAVWEVSRGTRR